MLLASGGCQSLSPAPDEPPREAEADREFIQALTWFSRGHLHELNQEYDEALQAFRTAKALDPDYPRTYLRIALNLLRGNRPDEAIDILEALRARRPSDTEPLIWLASIHRQQGDAKQALALHREAIMLNQESAALHAALAELMIQDNDEAGALEVLDEGVRKAAKPGLLHRLRGDLYRRRAIGTTDLNAGAVYARQALNDLEKAHAEEPEDPALWHAMGELHIRLREWEEGIRFLEKVRSATPDNLQAKERLAGAYETLGRLEDAAGVLEDMAVLQPTNPRLFMALASLYERMEKVESAILNYQLASRLGTPDPLAFLKLAVLQMETSPSEAASALREGLALLPDNPRLLEVLGYVEFNRKAYASAVKAFEQARAALVKDAAGDPTPNLELYLALAYYFDGHLPKLEAALPRLLDSGSDILEAFTQFVFQDDDRERVMTLIPLLEHIAEHDDAPGILLALVAYLHSFTESYEQAVYWFDRTYEQVAGTDEEESILTARFYFWYAAAHERVEQIDRAEELFYRCLELDPENAEAHNYMAYMWAEKGIYLDRAETYVLIALEAHPDSGAFIDTLGWIYYQQGRYEEAYDELRRAADIIPDDPTILDHLGDVYFKLDCVEKARVKWQRAHELDPDNEELTRKIESHMPLDKEEKEEESAVPHDNQDGKSPTGNPS